MPLLVRPEIVPSAGEEPGSQHLEATDLTVEVSREVVKAQALQTAVWFELVALHKLISSSGPQSSCL